MKQFIATAEEQGLRIDAWLALHYPTVRHATLKAFITQGKIATAEGRKCSKGDRIIAGTTYILTGDEPSEPLLAPNTDLPLQVVYEDDACIGVCKPAGLDTQPNSASETCTLANALLARWPELRGIGDSPLTTGILHRIDRDTSGLVLVAKTQAYYDAMRAQFTAHTVIKHYLALVMGRTPEKGHLEHLLAHNPRCPGRMIDATVWKDAQRPMRAVTDYERVRTVSIDQHTFSLLRVTILTGVTHQIRAQLSLAGFPILGDKRYGGYPLAGFDRHFLHAYDATLDSALTHKPLTIVAKLTPELQRLIG